MAVVIGDYFGIGKGLVMDGNVMFDIYGKMFDPNVPDAPSSYSSVSAHNETYSYSLIGFQPGLEVCMCIIELHNTGSSTASGTVQCTLQQWKNGGWVDGTTYPLGYQSLEAGYYEARWFWVGVDPDEIRPGITQYKFKWYCYGEYFEKTFTVSNLSFDTTPHPAGYLWVEGDNLCYVPPSIYSGSKDTGYKHIISYDSGYSGAYAGTDKKGSIWIPSSSSDGHIYYVSQYGTVQRTMPAYEWGGGPSYVGSNKSGFIRMTPSTSSIPEQVGYNYLCYVDGGGYRRRMGVGEI